MQCRSQPTFLSNKPDKIADVWEVRLPLQIWQQIQGLARRHQVTFSRITRFCLFQLVERSSLRHRAIFRNLAARDKADYGQAEKHHRHLVCLYGEDVKMIRLAAMELKVTVSRLIRMALRLYLRHLVMEKQNCSRVSDEALFWLAIKRANRLLLIPQNFHGTLSSRHYYLQLFPPQMRWGWPKQGA